MDTADGAVAVVHNDDVAKEVLVAGLDSSNVEKVFEEFSIASSFRKHSSSLEPGCFQKEIHEGHRAHLDCNP